MADLTPAQLHRAVGVLLGVAAGDALGAGYEFGAALGDDVAVEMRGGGVGPFRPGEWTDDTDMSLVIATVAAEGLDLLSAEALDRLAAEWWVWVQQSKDVGIQTRRVFAEASAAAGGTPTGDLLLEASLALHEATGHTAGNGSLMRTAPVAIAHLDDPRALVEAAHRISQLTHGDPDAAEACVLWCLAIRHAVLTGELDVRVGLGELDPDAAAKWAARIDVAEASTPSAFGNNGWVVEAFQGAWSAIVTTRGTGRHEADHLRLGLEAAVRGGGDTDTVAAIAGALLGAAYGASAVPATWRRRLHGWPGLRARDLTHLAALIATGGRGDAQGWPNVDVFDYSGWGPAASVEPVPHPRDPGVVLGAVEQARSLPDGVDAVVSLCRLGTAEAPATGVAPENHVEVWLIDKDNLDLNPHLDFVIADTARVVAELRAEGRTVLLHCVGAKSRTPTAAVAYSMAISDVGPDEALAEVEKALWTAYPNPGFRQALARLHANGEFGW